MGQTARLQPQPVLAIRSTHIRPFLRENLPISFQQCVENHVAECHLKWHLYPSKASWCAWTGRWRFYELFRKLQHCLRCNALLKSSVGDLFYNPQNTFGSHSCRQSNVPCSSNDGVRVAFEEATSFPYFVAVLDGSNRAFVGSTVLSGEVWNACNEFIIADAEGSMAIRMVEVTLSLSWEMMLPEIASNIYKCCNRNPHTVGYDNNDYQIFKMETTWKIKNTVAFLKYKIRLAFYIISYAVHFEVEFYAAVLMKYARRTAQILLTLRLGDMSCAPA